MSLIVCLIVQWLVLMLCTLYYMNELKIDDRLAIIRNITMPVMLLHPTQNGETHGSFAPCSKEIPQSGCGILNLMA